MLDTQLATPVAFIIFNRPDTTLQVFKQIARARPLKLLVIADGARKHRPGESDLCARTRAVVGLVDWPCEVLCNFSDINLGCRERVSSGIDWVFQNVDEAIIIEDDCLPNPTFFAYCQDMLAKYRSDTRISMICGDNFQIDRKIGAGSYYFSKYAHIWGWATWRRAWQHYDVTARLWPEFLASGNFERMTLPVERASWKAAFQGVYDNSIDTWDYQWTLACWCHAMFAVMPQVNLISNIGFGPQATHTTKSGRYAHMPTESLSWPLVEPSMISPNANADKYTASNMFKTSVVTRIARSARRLGRL